MVPHTNCATFTSAGVGTSTGSKYVCRTKTRQTKLQSLAIHAVEDRNTCSPAPVAKTIHRRRVVFAGLSTALWQLSLPESNSDKKGNTVYAVPRQTLGDHAPTWLNYLNKMSNIDATAAELPVIFVAGATGRSGLEVVRESRRRGLQVKAGVRDMAKAVRMGLTEMDGVEVVIADVNASSKEELVSAMRGANVVVCTTGYVPTYLPAMDRASARMIDNLGTINLVEAAESAESVHRFVLISSLLINYPNSASYKLLNTLGNVLSEKQEAEDFLRSKASALEHVIVRAGIFATQKQGNVIVAGADTFSGDEDASWGGALKCVSPFMAATSTNICAVTRQQVAEVAVSAALVPEVRNVILEVVARPDIARADTQALLARFQSYSLSSHT